MPNRTASPRSKTISLASEELIACMWSHVPSGRNHTAAISSSPNKLVMTVVSTQTLWKTTRAWSRFSAAVSIVISFPATLPKPTSLMPR